MGGDFPTHRGFSLSIRLLAAILRTERSMAGAATGVKHFGLHVATSPHRIAADCCGRFLRALKETLRRAARSRVGALMTPLRPILLIVISLAGCGGGETKTCAAGEACGGDIAAGRYEITSFCAAIQGPLISEGCAFPITVRSEEHTSELQS